MSRYSSPDNVMENFALMLGGASGIEAQERNEQSKLVSSVAGNTLHLPLPEYDHLRPAFIEQVAKLGITYGEPVDNLFYVATVPQGWSLKRTDHPMWSSLLDEQGRVRASVFYKGAFYDRVADIRLSCRLSYGSEAVGGWKTEEYGVTPLVGQVTWDDEVIAQTAPIQTGKAKPWIARERARDSAVQWVKANYPDYEDPLAYWDIERPEGVAVIPTQPPTQEDAPK